MNRTLVVVALALALAACSEEPRLAEVPTDDTLTTVPPITASTTAARIPADSQTPGAGFCPPSRDGYAIIELQPDEPSPRCTIVRSLDRLRFHNATPDVLTIDLGYSSHDLQPDELLTVGEQLGTVWEPGVHVVETSLYSVEIWLK